MSQECLIIPNLTGGLGNRLFQYAAAAGLAEQWKGSIAFSEERTEYNTHDAPTNIFQMFPNIDVIDNLPEGSRILQEDLNSFFTYTPFNKEPSSSITILRGFFQTEKYFPSMGIHPDWSSALMGQAHNIRKRTALDSPEARLNTWFIHFRFGDYKEWRQYHGNYADYYRKCLTKVPSGCRLHCFSDEPHLVREFVEKETAGKELSITWSESKRDVVTLYEMSLCRGGAIVANSTFSWWGAYFARQGALIESPDSATFRAMYPAMWGIGLPEAKDVVPLWGEKVSF